MVRDDLEVTLPKNMVRVREMTRKYIEYLFEAGPMLPNTAYVDLASRIAFLMLMYPKDPYILVFTLLSAVYRS